MSVSKLFLPLGSRLALFGYDAAAYDVAEDDGTVVRVKRASDVRLIN